MVTSLEASINLSGKESATQAAQAANTLGPAITAGGDSMLLQGKRVVGLVVLNMLLTSIICVLFFLCLAWGRYVPITAASNPAIVDEDLLPLFLSTLLTMMAAGALGGMLCNLRGLFTWIVRAGGAFPAKYELPFYTRPFVGAITGTIVFFIGNLLANALAFNSDDLGWESLPGRIPYIAIAFLAGFASRELMERMKEVVKTMFSMEAEANNTASSDNPNPKDTAGEARDSSSSTIVAGN